MKLGPPLGEMLDLMRPGGKVSFGLSRRRFWGRRFLGICLLAAVVGGPARLAGGVHEQASPTTQVQRAWVTAFAAGDTPQTITFTQPPEAAVGEPVALLASAAPGLVVSFASNTPAVCTVSGSTVTTTMAGACMITASQGGSASYAPAPEVARSFRVKAGQKQQTITFRQPPAAKRGVPVGEPVTLSASADSGLPVSFASATPPVCTVSASTVLTVAPGTCTIVASQRGNASYAAADEVRRSFQVHEGERLQRIVFKPQADTAVGVPVILSAFATSGLPVSFTANTPQVCTVAGSTVMTMAAGRCAITASQGGSAIYASAHVLGVFEVHAGKEPQTITFAPPGSATAGAPVTLSASASSDLPVSFTSGAPTVCTVSGSTVLTVTAGGCRIIASQGGSSIYRAADSVQHTFQVSPATQTITFAQPPDAKVKDKITLSATADSDLPVSLTPSTPTVCTVSGTTATAVKAGTCTITASQKGDDSYAPAENVAQSFQVNPTGRKPRQKSQTITFRPPPEAKAGVPVGEPVTLSASATSDLPVSFTSSTPPVCRVSGSTVTTMAAGACTITASQDGSASYAAADDVQRSFQVDPASSKASGALVFLLAAATMAAAGVTLAVRRLRLRSHPAPAHAASVRAVPDAGPPGAVSVQDTGTAATHTVRIEPNPGTSITTIEETQP